MQDLLQPRLQQILVLKYMPQIAPMRLQWWLPMKFLQTSFGELWQPFFYFTCSFAKTIWLQNLSLLGYPIPYKKFQDCNVQKKSISRLTIEAPRRWDTEILHQLYSPDDMALINQIPITLPVGWNQIWSLYNQVCIFLGSSVRHQSRVKAQVLVTTDNSGTLFLDSLTHSTGLIFMFLFFVLSYIFSISNRAWGVQISIK